MSKAKPKQGHDLTATWPSLEGSPFAAHMLATRSIIRQHSARNHAADMGWGVIVGVFDSGFPESFIRQWLEWLPPDTTVIAPEEIAGWGAERGLTTIVLPVDMYSEGLLFDLYNLDVLFIFGDEPMLHIDAQSHGVSVVAMRANYIPAPAFAAWHPGKSAFWDCYMNDLRQRQRRGENNITYAEYLERVIQKSRIKPGKMVID